LLRNGPQPYSTRILGVPLDQITQVGVNPSENLRLFIRGIIFEVFQPVCRAPKRFRRTVRQTDGRHTVGITALCVTSRGKNWEFFVSRIVCM